MTQINPTPAVKPVYSHGKGQYCFSSYVGAMHNSRRCYDCKDLYECRRMSCNKGKTHDKN